MSAPIRVGDILFGFCGGVFGRDSYDDKRVEGVGSDWVVAREVGTGYVRFASFDAGDVDDLAEYRERETKS